ncbi:uncharacterized protein LOC122851086 [Aphidius gifuensis]|uniref:uncharacterized protein LOC122851086 n=1 Tax=Aphidius gifuensis TaxID=684658 RepID=UPI001CDBEAFE|nr:uncharacterized protein LOC122851086 [Aphidius gifuensis]
MSNSISFRYNNNNDYNLDNYNSFEPKFLSQSVHFKEIPTKTIQITKTVAIKVPVPYPVKIPVHIPVHVPVPQIVKVPEPYQVTKYQQQIPMVMDKQVSHFNPILYKNYPQNFKINLEEKVKNSFDQHGQYDYSHLYKNTVKKDDVNGYNDHVSSRHFDIIHPDYDDRNN